MTAEDWKHEKLKLMQELLRALNALNEVPDIGWAGLNDTFGRIRRAELIAEIEQLKKEIGS